MIINYFLPEKYKLTYRDIEESSNISLFLVSLFTTYNIYFFNNYYWTIKIIFYYTLIDTIFLSYKKKDLFLHHILTFFNLYYLYYYNINLSIFNYSLLQILKVEISSIFLSLSSLLKIYKIKNKFSITLNGIFIITFLKYRVFDYYNNILNSDLFYIYLNAYDNYFKYYYVKITITAFYLINIYWTILIFKGVFLKLLKIK
tara:strand:+ start:1522 stop:2124 length:603 start_codon:yes stop_codon:yes gene_type:complete